MFSGKLLGSAEATELIDGKRKAKGSRAKGKG